MPIEKYGEQTFENIKHYNDDGEEFWLARELQSVLQYSERRNFINVVEKAQIACINSENIVENHFVDITQMVDIGSGATRQVEDIMLSRYACYLIVQNGDPRKEIIATGQTYFAVKTRQQEIVEDYDKLSEEQKRLAIREEIKKHNISLFEAANMAGVTDPKDYAIFQNSGYQGLYGGMNMRDIHAHKGLKKSHQILDYMGSTELAANLFRATQTDEKLRRDNVKGVRNANDTHYEVGKKVRETIADLGGTMPEDLPTPERSIKQLEKAEEKKKLNE